MADQKELLKLRGKLNNSRLDFGSAFNKYISENKVKAKRNGKWVWIDKSTGENWDDKIVETKINKEPKILHGYHCLWLKNLNIYLFCKVICI